MPLRLNRLERTASRGLRCSQLCAVIGIALAAGSGCNLLLDNDKRSLRNPLESRRDAGSSDAKTPDPSSDAGPDATMSEPEGGIPDAGRVANGCPSTGRAPECIPNVQDVMREGCGRCKQGQRTRERPCMADCTYGEWGEWTDCLERQDACDPGKTQEEDTGPCGDCKTGTGKRTRVCTSMCGWSDWSAEVCAPDATRCRPGASEVLDPVACSGMCSSRTVTRKCNDGCVWNEPEMGECTGQGVCMPGQTRVTTVGCNPEFCNKGQQQQMETCSASCAWGSGTPIGPCSIPPNMCRPLDLGGKGWRCRPGDQDFREYCHASTASEADRCTWDGSREPHDDPCE